MKRLMLLDYFVCLIKGPLLLFWNATSFCRDIPKAIQDLNFSFNEAFQWKLDIRKAI